MSIMPQHQNKVRKQIGLTYDEAMTWQDQAKICIYRNTGGLGDILALAMMAEDIKRTYPTMLLYYAVPAKYHEVLWDHPFIDRVIEHSTINRSEFLATYEVGTVLDNVESHEGREAPHRADIGAAQLGLKLVSHNSYIDSVLVSGKSTTDTTTTGNSGGGVLFAPYSVYPSRCLSEATIRAIYAAVPCQLIHSSPVLDLPTITADNFADLINIVASAKLCIGVDSGIIHVRGCCGGPMVVMFATSIVAAVNRCKYYENWTAIEAPMMKDIKANEVIDAAQMMLTT